MRGKGIKLRHSLLAALYFFFNEIGLKGGLLYTHLLTPFFYVWLLFRKREPVLLRFLLLLIPFDLIHLILGVELKAFLISNLLFTATYIFTASLSLFIKEYELTRIMRQLLVTNFVLTLIAIPVYFTPFKEWMWYVNNFSNSLLAFSRMALFTSESSYYALLFVPVAFYYLLKLILRQQKTSSLLIVTMVTLPLLLSLSLGVLGATVIAFMLLFTLHYKQFIYKKTYFYALATSTFVIVLGLLLLIVFKPDNALFMRIENIFTGNDSSAQGRLSDSFRIGWMIAKEKSLLFGAGLGQVKVLAPDIVKKYFQSWGDLAVYRIPNAVAETLAIFGILGLLIRFGLIFYLFFKTKVLSNYYRTVLFIFIFIYQFTGSFITNIAEYAIWALAFSQVFPQYNTRAASSEIKTHEYPN